MRACFLNSFQEQIYFQDYNGYTYQGDIGADDYPLNVRTAINAYYYTNWKSYGDIVDQMAIEHLVLYYAIKGGGIPSIAPSYDAAINAPNPPRWYMIAPEEQIKIDIAPEKAKNKAIYVLEGLYEKGKTEDLFLLHKALVSSDRGITKETGRDMLYADLNKFINGEFVKTDRRRTPVDFVEWAEVLKKDKNFVVAYAHLKDGLYYNMLFEKDMSIYNRQTNGKYPGDLKKAAEFLIAPTNIDEFTNLKNQMKYKWLEIDN